MSEAPARGSVAIDETLCSGLGECLRVAPDIVVLGDDGIARVTTATGDLARLEALADSCPMAAIAVRRLEGGAAA